MSEMMPAAFVMELQPNVPARKRQMSSAGIDLAPHTAASKAVSGMRVHM